MCVYIYIYIYTYICDIYISLPSIRKIESDLRTVSALAVTLYIV